MSHFTKLERANITDKTAFVAACKELFGFVSVKENVEIKDFYGKTMKVDLAFSTGKYHIALKKNESGKYDMISDWWGVRGEMTAEMKARMGGMNDADLQNAILRLTTKHAIVQKYRKLGFRADVREDANHNIDVKLTRA